MRRRIPAVLSVAGFAASGSFVAVLAGGGAGWVIFAVTIASVSFYVVLAVRMTSAARRRTQGTFD
jgi:uncharacterized membrane protein YjjP (DUF1212 family)